MANPVALPMALRLLAALAVLAPGTMAQVYSYLGDSQQLAELGVLDSLTTEWVDVELVGTYTVAPVIVFGSDMVRMQVTPACVPLRVSSSPSATARVLLVLFALLALLLVLDLVLGFSSSAFSLSLTRPLAPDAELSPRVRRQRRLPELVL